MPFVIVFKLNDYTGALSKRAQIFQEGEAVYLTGKQNGHTYKGDAFRYQLQGQLLEGLISIVGEKEYFDCTRGNMLGTTIGRDKVCRLFENKQDIVSFSVWEKFYLAAAKDKFIKKLDEIVFKKSKEELKEYFDREEVPELAFVSFLKDIGNGKYDLKNKKLHKEIKELCFTN